MVDSLDCIPYTGNRMDKTLELGQSIMNKWGTTLLCIKIAREIKTMSGANSKLEEASAVRDWIHGRVPYVSDPLRAELVGDPLWTLNYGGDCDDMAVLAGAILQALGHKASLACVHWKGRDWPSHAVCIDFSAECVVDPVPDVDVENWPPVGFDVLRMRYMDDKGDFQSLDGFFSKLTKSLAKVVTKVFPSKTLVGKLVDPLGLMDPKRNLNLAGRVSDVAGTAAAVVGAGWAIGAAAGAGYLGSSAAATAAGASGFLGTAAAGGSVALSALGAAITSKTAMGIGAAVLTSALTGAMNRGGGTPTEAAGGVVPPGYMLNPDGTISPMGTGGGYNVQQSASGGGGGGGGADDYSAYQGAAQTMPTAVSSIPTWLIVGGMGLAALLLMNPKKKVVSHG